MAKKIFVLDTNVLLSDSNALYAFKKHDIVIPLKVLEEVDKHKKRQDGVGACARHATRILDDLRVKGNLTEGVKIRKNLGNLFVVGSNWADLPEELEWSDPDNKIICAALTLKKNNPDVEVIPVSQDVNFRVRCDALGLKAEDYISNQVVEKVDEIYTGFTTHLVDDQLVDRFYSGEKIYIDPAVKALCPNQFVMLVSNANEKKTALAKFKNYNYPLSKVREYRDGVWEIRAKNKEQQFAFDMLMDPEIKIVSLLGTAGCGKTLIAIAAALEQILGNVSTYKKLIVSRPVQPMGRDIGFLPGTLEEKMTPWLAPVQDNLEFLMGDDKEHLKMLVEKGTIEMEALTFIRGRSISDAFIIIDEAQNLSAHELKTIITRVGEDTKIVLTGDVCQIDNAYVDATTNGLTYAVEKFKDHEIAGHVTLQKGERSAVATLAASIL